VKGGSYRCGSSESIASRRVRRAGAGRTGHELDLAVDVHCHVLAMEAEELARPHLEMRGEGARVASMIGRESAEYNARMMESLAPRLTDVRVRLDEMDSRGIDVQVLSPSPTQYYYWAERELSRELVRIQNQRIAEMCAEFPNRFVGLGNVSLQYPDLAAEQLGQCVRDLGFKGVEVSSAVNGREIGDAEFAPFWRRAEELGVVVFLHPLGTSLGERVGRYYLSNLIGVPLETTIALSHLIFGGVLDRYPGLKVCAAHGGGFMGSYWGRFQHGWEVRPECRSMRKSPYEYLRQLYFDTVVMSPGELRHLVESFGADHLLMGSDYPFDMGHRDPMGFLSSTCGLAPRDLEKIRGLNAAQLFGLDLPAMAPGPSDCIHGG
jgi:aminocarboxymuconate-semialdehyde decarboxylase